MSPMTRTEANRIAAAPLDHSKQAMADALIVLRDALRAAEAQVVKASATEAAYFVARNNLAVASDRITALEPQVAAMREQAAQVAERYGDVTRGCETIKPGEAAQTIADAIRALPVPAARTYEDGVRDALDAAKESESCMYGEEAKGARWVVEKIAALISPASAPTPQPLPGVCPQCRDPECAGPAPTPVTPIPHATLPFVAQTPGVPFEPFDCEAALEAARQSLRGAAYTRSATINDLHQMLEAALAAGRKP